MRSDARLLVVGSDSYRQAVGTALPRCRRVDTNNALDGLWQVGHGEFDAVLISLSVSRNTHKAIRSLRRVCPQARIVVSCPAADEPGARRALHAGADEYIIEPVTREDLETALRIPSGGRIQPHAPVIEPSWEEKAQFVDVLRNLSQGPQATLARLVELLQRTFQVQYAAIRIDGLVATAGDTEPTVLEEPVLRQGAAVGAVSLGQHRHGPFPASAAVRLGDYARLVEVVVAVADERAHWQDLAWTDDLSRLRNRRYFERRLDELVGQCRRQRAHLTVLLFDIDDFKRYNDEYGHQTGDAVIREVACLLTRCSRESDLVARHGGDEFAVVLWDAEGPRVPGSRHPTELVALAERYRQMIGTHTFRCLGPHAPGPVTISGGMACFPWDGRSRTELLRAADEALLAAKQTGKNRIELAGGPADTATSRAD
ncbi:MAG: diguanylate cyclase [Phycisphaerae bacterium]|jgi:diguanylate cyclase (GGDEF)-like protein